MFSIQINLMIKHVKVLFLKNKLLKNFSVLTFSNILTQLLAVFISIKIARSLTPYNFGIYNLLFLHVTMFSIISSLGLRNIIIQKIARNIKSVQSVFYNSFIIRSLSTLICIIIYFIYYNFYTDLDDILFILVIFGLLSTVYFDLFESIAFGLEKMEFSGIINFASYFLWFIFIIMLPDKFLTLNLIFGTFVIFNLIKSFIYFLSLYKSRIITEFNFEYINKNEIIKISQESFPYYYLALFTLLSNQVPLLFLEYRSGVEQIGFFNLAGKILLPLNLVVNTALAAIFPTLSKLFMNSFKSFIEMVKMIFILICIFGVVCALLVSLFREDLILLLYGYKYINSSLVLTYQSWYVALYSVVCLIGTILGSINKQKQLAYLSILCTIIQVPILWIGSKYGAIYLSAAFLISTTIVLGIHLFAVYYYLSYRISLFFYIKIILLFVFGYLISIIIPSELNTLYKLFFIISLVFSIAYILFKKYKNQLCIN